MENIEPKQGRFATMSCESTDRSVSELESEGYKYDWSFHATVPAQWEDACRRVQEIKNSGFFQPVLVQGQTKAEQKDGVAYIYKKPTDRHAEYEKDMGYNQ